MLPISNIDMRVVTALRERGVNTAQMCGCNFLEDVKTFVQRIAGPFTMVMPDVWGSFDKGARHVIQQLLDNRLIADDAVVMFCASDRAHFRSIPFGMKMILLSGHRVANGASFYMIH